VVDDNADIVHMLAMFLQAEGHMVVTAGDAVEAIARARETAPQLCLLDIGLPGISGNALAQQLRALPEMEGAMLVAVSGYGRKEDRELSADAGFDQYFVKPLDMGELQALISGLQERLAPA